MTATIPTAPRSTDRSYESVDPGERIIPMTYEEYLNFPGVEGRSEWVDGKAIIFMPPKAIHAQIAMFLATLMRMFVVRRDLGIVIATPMEMRILDPWVSREPDILFVTKPNLGRLNVDRLDGPADLAVEFISRDSIGRDRGDKFYEYERAGIGEYWIADPRPGLHRFDSWVRGEDEKFRAVLADADGRYHSTMIPGFWLRPEWLWETPLPNEFELLEEILSSVRTQS